MNSTILDAINPTDTYLESITREDETIIFKFYVRRYSSDTEIVLVKNFNYWSNISDSPIYNKYVRPKYAIYNRTSQCALASSEKPSKFVTSMCKSFNYIDPQLDQWNATYLEPADSPSSNIQIEQDHSNFYIYCWPHSIQIGEILNSPPYPLNISNRVSFSIDGKISYDAQATVVRFDHDFNYPIKTSHLKDIDSSLPDNNATVLYMQTQRMRIELESYHSDPLMKLVSERASFWTATIVCICVFIFCIACLWTYLYIMSLQQKPEEAAVSAAIKKLREIKNRG